MSTQPKGFLTPQQYLEIERNAEVRHEYFRGDMSAMSGAARAHILLVANLRRDLGNQIRNRDCELHAHEMRVWIPASEFCTYPDFAAICDEPSFTDDAFNTLLNPRLIIEVLSPSTEAYDRGRKFEHYRSIDSLREYLLVASERMYVELFTRQDDGRWVLSAANQPGDVIELASIECRLRLADIYERVKLAEVS